MVKLADFDELGRLGGERAQLADACSAPEVLRKVPTHTQCTHTCTQAHRHTHARTHIDTDTHTQLRPFHRERERSSARLGAIRLADARVPRRNTSTVALS